MNATRACTFATVVTLAATGHGLAAGAGHAHDHGHAMEGHAAASPFGEPGDPRKPARPVPVVMTDGNGKMAFIPSAIEVRQGEQIKFMLRNNGGSDHELVIGTLETNREHARQMAANPEMKHDDPNARRLEPGKTGQILWRFTKAGEFDFSCLIPGHREAGMTGTIIVKP